MATLDHLYDRWQEKAGEGKRRVNVSVMACHTCNRDRSGYNAQRNVAPHKPIKEKWKKFQVSFKGRTADC